HSRKKTTILPGSAQLSDCRLRTLRSWFLTHTLIVCLWRSMPIKFMVHSLCGNRNGYERNTNRDVYHELKGTGTRLRPPLHSFRTRGLWPASWPPRPPERRSRKREHNSHFSPLRKPHHEGGRVGFAEEWRRWSSFAGSPPPRQEKKALGGEV